jgi:hypothetical protein
MLVIIEMVSASIQVCGDKEFRTTEPITLKSNAKICFNQPEDQEVILYIIEDKESIPLEILKVQNISNTQFSCKNIWTNPLPGDYDVFVDCNNNEEFDSDANEPFDSLNITAVKGSGLASIGENDVGNHSWRYDPESPDLDNEMLQIELKAERENIILDNITIQAKEQGNDTKIAKLEIYLDEDGNGILDSEDVSIGAAEPAYLEDNGITTVFLDYTLNKDISESLLIVYQMEEETEQGDYSLEVMSLYGVGEFSNEQIEFIGLPLSSGKKTVLEEKSCIGRLSFTLSPNPAIQGQEVTADMNDLQGCENKSIVLRLSPCGSSILNEVDSCEIEDGEGCSVTFTADGNDTYHACIDKNNDGDYIDFGEFSFRDLTVLIPEIQEPENMTGENMTETDMGQNITQGNETTSPTGSVIEDLLSRISDTGNLFVLLEVTLLLILFVLVLILFRLKGPGRAMQENSNNNKNNGKNKKK